MTNYAYTQPEQYVAPPPPLAAAIAQASQQYGVPADIETGIWHIESHSTFPNPFVNSKGYGGLFGTTDWNGSTQAQADLSAQILASTLRASGGNIGQALSAYSGGAYTSVPGETTFGTITVPANPGPIGPTGATNPNSTLPNAPSVTNPQTTNSTFGSVANDITGSTEEAAIRLGEIILAAILLIMGLKGLQAAISGSRFLSGAASAGGAVARPAGAATGAAYNYGSGVAAAFV